MIPFEVHEHSEKFKEWEVKGLNCKRDECYYLHVAFRRAVEESCQRDFWGIDVNEKSVDLAVIKPDGVRFIGMDASIQLDTSISGTVFQEEEEEFKEKTLGRIGQGCFRNTLEGRKTA